MKLDPKQAETLKETLADILVSKLEKRLKEKEKRIETAKNN